MPIAKKAKTKANLPKKEKNTLVHEDIVELDETEDVEIQPDEELDPEIIEALKLKEKKPKKATHATDYIPELERGEIDLDFKIEEDY